MRKRTFAMLILASLTLTLSARQSSECDLSIVVNGQSRTEYHHRGATYIEAVRGSEYTLRITNPTSHRVAVALAVDGLNTIDAKHTDGWNASKWVLEPYESTEIAGWQVSGSTARRFFFTGERNSYGAALGATDNLGVIEAIFYRERQRPIAQYHERRDRERDAAGAPSAAPRSQAEEKATANDEYAATGMGGRTQNEVTRVEIDLDPRPIASVRLRYEFRPQLVKLGVIPKVREPLDRREKARGFEYCPEPK
jgi:hypothetical protein